MPGTTPAKITTTAMPTATSIRERREPSRRRPPRAGTASSESRFAPVLTRRELYGRPVRAAPGRGETRPIGGRFGSAIRRRRDARGRGSTGCGGHADVDMRAPAVQLGHLHGDPVAAADVDG